MSCLAGAREASFCIFKPAGKDVVAGSSSQLSMCDPRYELLVKAC
jgi:hypothetical protein